MKGANSPLLRVIYIILVPIVLLIILLNSGWLQRYVPAATVHGTERYTVTRYNFYYFDYYNDFLDSHADELETLGYNTQESAGKQSYDGDITWKEFFQQAAETVMAETAYYYDLAVDAGYEFSDEELAPIQEKLDANEALRTQYGISAKNFYVSYYGAGMDETRYTEELTRKVKAQAYKKHLIDTCSPDESEISAWLSEHPEEEYRAVELQIITLDAQPDRSSGEIGTAQISALQSRLERLEERYESGVSFDTLQSEFSSCSLGNASGYLTATTSAQLPDVLTQQLLRNQNELSAGQIFALTDETEGTAYLIRIAAISESGPRLDAIAALSEQAIQEQKDTALSGEYTVTRNSFGMLLATS